ncbi:T9SS type A sorting domain-containing protein [Flavobacterium hydrophilum]|nr:T9SS type A sorting domain-containing protein [Flavobacterium hydrophilum]
MKKHLLLLLLITSFWGYSQTQATVTPTAVNGARTVTFVNPAPIEIDGELKKTDATGFGLANGTLNIVFKGGTGSYDYIWTKDGLSITAITDWSKLAHGEYSIKAKDKNNGCESVAYPFVIGQPDKLEVVIDGNSISCHGKNTGTLSITKKLGGTVTTGYTYKWFKSNGNTFDDTGLTGEFISNGLYTGTYQLEITDNASPVNTALSNTFLISEPLAAISVAESKTNVSCNGSSDGTISLTISGGTSGYSILWSDNITTTYTAGQPDRTGLSPGDYSYTITDTKGCIYSSAADIKITAPPAVIITSITPTQPSGTNSNDGKITISASGGTGTYTYLLTKGGITSSHSSNIITNLVNGTYEVVVKDNNNCTSLPSIAKLEALAITFVSQQNVKCYEENTGTITVQASGGTLATNSTYQYQWYKDATKIDNETNATINNLGGGSYSVQVMDDKMVPVTSDIYTIISPLQPLSVTSNAATQQQNASCNGGNDGKIEINVTGGTPTYTYKWADGPTSKDRYGLTAGTYSLTVTDANGCTQSLNNIIIADPSKITISSPSITHVAINGQSTGSIIFPSDPSGGNGDYTYQWTSNNGFSASIRDVIGLKAGIYYLTILDKKLCQSIQYNFTVLEKTKLEVTIKESAFIKCNGDSNGQLVAEVTGGVAPYKYRWEKNGATVSGENSASLSGIGFGDYSVFVTDSANPEPGPFANAEQLNFKLKQPDKLKVSLAKQTNVLCFGAATGAIEITIEGGTAPYTQQWTKDGVSYTGNLNQLAAGEYNVTVKDAVGHECTATLTDAVKITQPTAPLQISSTGPVHLKGFETNDGSISVTVSGGKPNYSYEWRKGTAMAIIGTNSSITNLSAGIYHLIVKDANNCTLPEIDYTVTQPDKLEVVSLTQTPFTNILCKGDLSGEYTIIVKGGVKEYSFEWLNTSTGKQYTSIETISIYSTASKASGLGAGNYVVSVKDANSNALFGTNTFTITEPDKLAFTYTKENVSCFGGNNGTIKLNITGGTKDTDLAKPYSIISSGGTVDNQNGIISGLSEGTYTIKVTDINLCGPVEQTIQISQPAKSVIIEENATVTPSTGFGLATGKIEISAVGGTLPYNYQWKNNAGLIVGTNSPSLVNVVSGNYSIVVTDSNNCFDSKTYTIEQPTKPVLTETHLQPKCNGLSGSLLATANGGAAYNQIQTSRIYTYKLKNKATAAVTTINGNTANFANIVDGDYTLTATDASGIDSNSIDVQFKQPDPIVVSLVSKSNVRCFGDKDGAITISVSGGTPLINGTPEYNYRWKKKNTTSNNYENFTPTSLNTFPAGIYAVEVRDANFDDSDAAHCIGILEDIEITQPADFGFDIEKIIYSNPTAVNGNDGSLHFEITGGKANYEYKFYTKNAAGAETIIQTISNSPLMTADFAGLIKDHYYISAKDATGCIKYADFDFRDNPLTISVNQTQNISCYDANNGTIKANANGGFGQKKYTWYCNNVLLPNENQDVLLNVKPGIYYAVVKDSKKVEVTSNAISITQPDPVAFSTIQQPVKCFGNSNGQVTLTASGGNGTFRYRYSSNNVLIKDWENFSNGKTTIIADLAEGDYSIEVEDSQQCQSTKATVKITSPTSLIISNTIITPATGKGLSNGSISITAQGANGQYSYQWYKSDNTSANQTASTAINLAAGKYYVVVSDIKGCNLTSPLIEVTEPPILETTIAVQNVVLCNGDKNGSLKPTTTGGFLKSGDSYTYQWFENGNPTALASTAVLSAIGKGAYYAIATDSNGNKATSSILVVTEPAVLSNMLTSDYMLCGDLNDWTINATPSGGTQPYNYSWNTGAKTASIQNVPPGNYSVLVSDSHGCTITKMITLTAPAHLDATENIKIPTCYGGSDATIVVKPVAGIAPYTYSWNTGEKSNTLKNAAAGDYTIEITDSKGCIISRTYTIANPPKDVIDLGKDVTLCFDQTLTINATIDDDKATYLWKSDKGFSSNKAMITVSEPANYTVTVTNKLGCEATDTIQIFSQNTAISAEFAMSSQVFKNEKIVIVDISNPAADEIEWVLPAKANVVTKNKDYAEISFSEAGEYEITLNTKKGNCTAFQTKQILVTEGEYEENPDDEPITEKKFDLKIYPNPSQGIFTVDVTLDKVMPAHVKVYNLNNNLLIDSKTEEGKDNYLFNFNLGGLPPGLYFVLFESQQGSKLRKIIIQ